MARSGEPVESESAESEWLKSEDDESSSEEADSQTQTAAPEKLQPAPPPSSSSEFVSDSESEPDAPDSNTASKPMEEETQKSMIPNSPATKSSAAKRPAAEAAAAEDAKKKKSKESDEPNTWERKPCSFPRFWSEDDEIVILRGMIDHTAQKNSIDFTDYIKKILHSNFTKGQLQDKVRRLKKKFVNNKSKEKEGKGRRAFSNPHDKKVYDLSELIWGNGAGKEAENGGASSSKGKEVVVYDNDAMEEEKRQSCNIPGGGGGGGGGGGVSMEERMLVTGKEIYEEGRMVEMEQAWGKLKVEEMLLYRKQLELRLAQTNLVLRGFN